MIINLIPTDVSVPIGWLVGAMWTVTMAAAGSLGKAVYSKVADMAKALDEIAKVVQDLDKRSVRTEVNQNDHERRISNLERTHG